jgi:hypothetical protein
MQWIQTSEQLPEKMTPVLIAGQYPSGAWYVEESYRDPRGHFKARKIDPPTHWMPLPPPPTETQ